MKLVANIVRVITGILFIFSGFIKSNDPIGFKIKLEEYFHVFATDLAPTPDTMIIHLVNPDMGVDETYTRILHNEAEKKFSYTTTPWESVDIKDDKGVLINHFDKTTLSIMLDGQELYKGDIQKEDAAPTKFELSATIGSKAKKDLYGKTITIENQKPVLAEEAVSLKEYAKSESWLAKLCMGMIPIALYLAVFICVFEIVLGITLLIGWRRNLTLWLLALMIVFFTFLTWYSATFNKVTDCGCFGNAIPLTPWESFVKDLILCVFILILILLRKYIKPVFSPGFSWKLIVISSVLSIGFAFYCWYYLPVFNFLKFKKGNDIEKLTTLGPDAKLEKREMVFIYTKGGKDYEFTTEELTTKKVLDDPGFKYKDRRDKIVQEGDKPEIHDFAMADSDGGDHLKEFYEKDEYKLLMVSQGLDKARPKAMEKIAVLAKEWTEKSKLQFWALTSTSPAEAEVIRHQYQLPFKFYYGDNTNLKSIIRSNPGLLLIKKGTVIETWPSTDLPDYKEVLKEMK